MPHAEYPDLAQVAYAAYGQTTGGLTHDGRPMPEFEDLGDTVTAAWQAAAQAVVDTYVGADADDPMPGELIEPAPQTPSVGCIVLVPMDRVTNNGQDYAPAIITQVWSPQTINVRVLGDSSEAPIWRTSVTYVDDLDTLDPTDPGQRHRWTWPPRV